MNEGYHRARFAIEATFAGVQMLHCLAWEWLVLMAWASWEPLVVLVGWLLLLALLGLLWVPWLAQLW